MVTERIIFWSIIAICTIVFIVIFSGLLKSFNKLLKKAEKHGEEVRKRQELLNNSTSNPRTFYEVIIEPSCGSDLSDVLKEMKILSTFIKLPVCAVFNNRKLYITAETDLDEVVRCYHRCINTINVKVMKP